MIKKTILLAALIGSTHFLSAQLYFKGSVGYHTQTISEVLGTQQSFNSNGLLTSEVNLFGTTGKGIHGELAFGYQLETNVSVELGAEYLLGQPTQQSGVSSPASEYTRDIKTTHLRVNPSIVIHADQEGDGLKPYAQIGVLIPLVGSTKSESINAPLTGFPMTVVVDAMGNTAILNGSANINASTSGTFSIGYLTAVGATKRVNDKMSIFGEIQVSALSIKSKSTSFTSFDPTYTLNGNPLDEASVTAFMLPTNLEQLPIGSKERNYVQELNSSSNVPGLNPAYDATQPTDFIGIRPNYSSIGINIGIKYTL